MDRKSDFCYTNNKQSLYISKPGAICTNVLSNIYATFNFRFACTIHYKIFLTQLIIILVYLTGHQHFSSNIVAIYRIQAVQCLVHIIPGTSMNILIYHNYMYILHSRSTRKMTFFMFKNIGNSGWSLSLSQTPCVHHCIHCLLFLRRMVRRLLMDSSAYQSPSIQPQISGYYIT